MTMVPKYPIGAHLLVNQGEFLSFAAPWLAAQECDGHRVVVVEHHECPFSDDILYALACKSVRQTARSGRGGSTAGFRAYLASEA